MSVEVKYIVKRKGKEIMSFTSQKEANAYDKMLDISDELTIFLGDKFNEVLGSEIDEAKMEELSIFLASNKDSISKLLRGQSLEKDDSPKPKSKKKIKPNKKGII